MKKFMLYRLFCIVLFLVTGFGAIAQSGGTPLTVKALMLCNEGKIDSAEYCIDRDVKEGGVNDAWSWTIRGYVYKAKYKDQEKSNIQSPARKTSLESYKTAIKLDTAEEYIKNTHQGIRFLSNSYYNDAVTSLNTEEYEQSQVCYSAYKEGSLIIEPEIDFKEKDILYYNVLGSSVFSILADQEPDLKIKQKYIRKALSAYAKVLELDPRNFSANYNTGVLFYNLGVNKIKEIDPLAPFDTVIAKTNESNEMFERAKPFMLHANNIDPSKREVYIGLGGIYFSLNMIDSSNFYSKKLVELDERSESPSQIKYNNFLTSYTPVKTWIIENERLPLRTSEDPVEKRYAIWCDEMRYDYVGKRLSRKMIDDLEALPEWSWE